MTREPRKQWSSPKARRRWSRDFTESRETSAGPEARIAPHETGRHARRRERRQRRSGESAPGNRRRCGFGVPPRGPISIARAGLFAEDAMTRRVPRREWFIRNCRYRLPARFALRIQSRRVHTRGDIGEWIFGWQRAMMREDDDAWVALCDDGGISGVDARSCDELNFAECERLSYLGSSSRE